MEDKKVRFEKYKRLFVEKYGFFNEEEWDSLFIQKPVSIRHSVNEFNRKIDFYFDLYSPAILIKLFGIEHRNINFHFSKNNLPFFFDSEILSVLISKIIKIPSSEFEATLTPPNLLIKAKSSEFEKVLESFSEKLEIVLGDLVDIEGFRVSVNKIYYPVEEKIIYEEPSNLKNKDEFVKKEKFFLFLIEKKQDHKGNKKCKLGITDWKNFYLLSATKQIEIDIESLEENKYYWCTYSLLYKNSKFAQYYDGYLNSIEPAEEEIFEEDIFKDPIVPLCIHTKNSAFDGLYSVKDFVLEAKKRKHHCLAVTDISSVQGFSDLEKYSKEYGINPIYGAELELIDDEYPIVVNDTELWDKKTVCVFDIETTGLHASLDEVIEISIFKYHDGACSEKFTHLLKPSKPLSENIVNLTNITDDLLEREGRRDIKNVFEEAKEFVKGSLLVAHNGIAFDLPFLNTKLEEYGVEKFKEPLLDSMRLSQALFIKQSYKSHSLSAVCKRASIPYDETKAHRASHDVHLTWGAFDGYLIPELYKQKVDIWNDLGVLNDRLNKSQIFNHSHGGNVLVYAKNQEGIRDLYEIISEAHTNLYFGRTTVNKSLLKKFKSNLVIVSPPINSYLTELVFQGNKEKFKKESEVYDYIILPPPSHFIHDINRNKLGFDEIERILSMFYKWCLEINKPVLFNTAIRYLNIKDYEKYSILITAKGISGKRHFLYSKDFDTDKFPDFSYKNTKEILREYDFLNLGLSLYENAISTQKNFLNNFSFGLEVIKKKLYPPKIEGCEDKLKEECLRNMKNVYGENPNEYILNKYESEMRGIIENDYSVIYWVSHLLVKKSVENGYLVGSRGSVGSSFVAFLLNISEVNPLPPHYFCKDCSYFEVFPDFLESGFDLEEKKCPHCLCRMKSDGHNIPFETFLGFGGNKVPDIDLNFSGEYQMSAHNFLKEYFGDKKVFRAGTISSMAEKTAFGIVKTYIEELNEKEIQKGMKITTFTQGKMKWLVNQIIDVKRTSGQHPGGILVIPQNYSIYDFTPVNYPANDTSSEWLTTHFEFDDLHDALLKFDILGHDDPTTLAMLKEWTGHDPMNIPYDDEKVLKLYRSYEVLGLKDGDLIHDDNTGAIGLPEFGTLLTRKIIKICQPKSFADLIRISGFSHGTGVWKMNIDSLIEKENKKLNEVITCRDDIMLYLLSMKLTREDAFNITEGIRKGKGISVPHLEILKKHNIPDWYIESAKKISYIFPKAHAAAYVLMSWKIAYYKLYYPLAFYSVYFSICHEDFVWSVMRTNDPELIKRHYEDIFTRFKSSNWSAKQTVTTKEKASLTVYEVALEFLRRGFKFKDVDINKSAFAKFVPIEEENSVLIPFIVIDGLGEIKSKSIEEERIKGGDYISIEDLKERTRINNTVIKTLLDKGVIPIDWANLSD